MASQHDLADAYQLRSTEGWQTLQAILQSTGEPSPIHRSKRRRGSESESGSVSGDSGAKRRRGNRSTLAKQFSAVRLNERKSGS